MVSITYYFCTIHVWPAYLGGMMECPHHSSMVTRAQKYKQEAHAYAGKKIKINLGGGRLARSREYYDRTSHTLVELTWSNATQVRSSRGTGKFSSRDFSSSLNASNG